MTRARSSPTAAAERTIGRLLIAMTYASVAILLVGVGLMALNGISPLAEGPAFDVPAIPAELLALSPTGFLWLGLMVVIATPIVRVIGAAIAFGQTAQWIMVWIALGILVVIGLGVGLALVATA
jgi:uncharacterized membrane protein